MFVNERSIFTSVEGAATGIAKCAFILINGIKLQPRGFEDRDTQKSNIEHFELWQGRSRSHIDRYDRIESFVQSRSQVAQATVTIGIIPVCQSDDWLMIA